MNEQTETKQVRCQMCSNTKEITAYTSEWNKFLSPFNQELIQNIFPDMPADERELLISGVCGKCFDQLFKDTEEL